MESRYGQASQAHRYQMDLRLRTRKKCESLHEYFYEMRRMSSLAWPGEQGSKATESNAINAFITGLSNPSIRREVLMRRTATLEEAFDIASTLEAIEAGDRTHSEMDGFDPDGRKR